MMRDFSPGLAMRRNWGTIAKCPHCDKINIIMTHKNQITCRGEKCQRAQARVTDRAWKRGKRKADATGN